MPIMYCNAFFIVRHINYAFVAGGIIFLIKHVYFLTLYSLLYFSFIA